MAILLFVLSFILLVAGLAGAYMSIDLLPDDVGLIYVFAGAVAFVGAAIVFALGVLAMRVGELTRASRDLLISNDMSAAARAALALAERPEAHDAGPAFTEAPLADIETEAAPHGETLFEEAGAAEVDEAAKAEAGETGEATASEAREAPVESGGGADSPPGDAGGPAAEAHAGPPTLIGRYSSAGANYMIFSDGSIEAETDEGSFKFASMTDFKQFLSDRSEKA